jgi:hypothetical protein
MITQHAQQQQAAAATTSPMTSPFESDIFRIVPAPDSPAAASPSAHVSLKHVSASVVDAVSEADALKRAVLVDKALADPVRDVDGEGRCAEALRDVDGALRV